MPIRPKTLCDGDHLYLSSVRDGDDDFDIYLGLKLDESKPVLVRVEAGGNPSHGLVSWLELNSSYRHGGWEKAGEIGLRLMRVSR